jgi:hypothetical protein
MSDENATTPVTRPQGKAEREARAAAALRANLSRRKAQKRARDAETVDDGSEKQD